MTLERPMFPPVHQARRGFLVQAAAVVAGGAALGTFQLQNHFERRYGVPSGYCWVSEKPCHAENDAFETLVATPPTTKPGLLAWLDYFQELSSEFETEWMVWDRASAGVLIESFAASLKNIGVQS